LDFSGLIVRGVTTAPGPTPVVAKHGVLWNVGLELRDTVPAIWPGAGGALNVIIALTVASIGEPLSALKLSSEPVAAPDEIVGRNVATKVPGLVEVATLQAETSPTVWYVPVIAGIDNDESPVTAVWKSYVPV